MVSKLLLGNELHSLSMSLFCLLMDFFDQLIQKVFCWGHTVGLEDAASACWYLGPIGSWHVTNAGCFNGCCALEMLP